MKPIKLICSAEIIQVLATHIMRKTDNSKSLKILLRKSSLFLNSYI